MVFRGWLLNATIKDMTKWLAVFINAVMYLATHFPSMIQNGVLFSKFAPSYFIGFMSFSVIFSVSFLKSKNLFIPITMHMLFDLMAYVLF
jgi:membrane protease YdiL (CAAX protease family)